MRRQGCAVVPCVGIGREVTPAALEVLAAAGRAHGFALDLTEHPWGCDYFVVNGCMMSGDCCGTPGGAAMTCQANLMCGNSGNTGDCMGLVCQ